MQPRGNAKKLLRRWHVMPCARRIPQGRAFKPFDQGRIRPGGIDLRGVIRGSRRKDLKPCALLPMPRCP
jgi:hypothetical protein